MEGWEKYLNLKSSVPKESDWLTIVTWMGFYFIYFSKASSCTFFLPLLTFPPTILLHVPLPPPLPCNNILLVAPRLVEQDKKIDSSGKEMLTCSEELVKKGKWCNAHATELYCKWIFLLLKQGFSFSPLKLEENSNNKPYLHKPSPAHISPNVEHQNLLFFLRGARSFAELGKSVIF